MSKNPKQIPNPDNSGEMIDNPNYNPELDEDGNPIETKETEEGLIVKAKAEMKSKLDNAYAARDEALLKVKEFERKERDAEVARLKEEGKLAEAHEKELAEKNLEVADKDNQIKELKAQIVVLTRDNVLNSLMAGYEFRNARASKMAMSDITSALVQNDKGEWQSKDGKSIEDHVKSFLEHEDNAFLLKPKVSTGTGVEGNKGKQPPSKKPTSVFDMSQEDVLKRAAERIRRPT